MEILQEENGTTKNYTSINKKKGWRGGWGRSKCSKEDIDDFIIGGNKSQRRELWKTYPKNIKMKTANSDK